MVIYNILTIESVTVMTKRILCLALALLTVLCTLVSCKKNNQGGGDNGVGAGISDEYFFPENLPEADYGGAQFRVLNWGATGGEHWSACEFVFDQALTGEVVNEAVKLRDAALEEKYNVKVTYIEKKKEDIAEFARTSIDAGSDDFDVCSLSVREAATRAISGDFINLYEYNNIFNFDEDWWDKNSNEQFSYGNHLYFTTSDLTLVDKQAIWVLFFTKGLLNQYPSLTEGYENGIYSMVEQGDWTIEQMYNMVKTVSQDDGDGVRSAEDVYGHAGEGFSVNALMVGCGSRITEKDQNDIPRYIWTENINQHVASFEYVHPIVKDNKYSILSGDVSSFGFKDPWVEGFGSMMNNNKILFNCTGMNRCKLYRDLECDFGILPVPKANKEQDRYYCYSSMIQANTIAIPRTNSDPERTAILLEAWTCLASQTTYSAYIEKALTYKYLRDDDSANMLDIIINSRLYDPVDVYEGMGTGNGVYTSAKPTSLSSTVQKLKKLTESALTKKQKQFESLFARMDE